MNNKLQNTFLGMMIVAGIVLCALLLASGKKEDKQGSGANKTTAQAGSSAPIINAPTTQVDVQCLLAVVTSVNAEAKSISFRSFDTGEDYNFRIEKPTYIYTAYDNAMTLAQLAMGDVAYITFDALSNTLQEIRLTRDAVKHSRVTGVSVNTAYRMLSFYNKNYEYSRDVVVVSGAELITPEQLSAKDVLTVYEKDGKVVSVVVDRGHGYLTLTGIELFLGGYVDIGGETIRTIEKDMMVMMTEGTYKVQVSHNGYYGCKTIEIKRDKVATVDFSEILPDTVENGNVFFSIDVDGAKLYLNGEETDYSEGILTLPVGEYSVRVTAEGYENYVDKITVIADYQKINIKMQSDGETTAAEESTTKQSGSSAGVTSQYETETTTKVSATNRVYIDGPENAIIYFDETYLGIAPLDFAMVTGEHTIIVLSGTTVKSYTVNLVEGGDDVRYDFTPKEE